MKVFPAPLPHETHVETRAPKSQPQPPLLRIPEVARELALSERTIQSYLDQGLLERVKIGPRTVRVSRASLQKLMGQAAE